MKKQLLSTLMIIPLAFGSIYAQWTDASSSINSIETVWGSDFYSSTNGVVVGCANCFTLDPSEGVILRTTDAGSTYQKVHSIAEGDIRGAHFPSEFVGYACGWEASSVHGTVFKTTDGGITWSDIDIGFVSLLEAVYFVNDSVGYVAGENIYRTLDGGATWTIVLDNPTAPNFFYDMYFTGAGVGYAITGGQMATEGSIFKTLDSGATWTESNAVSDKGYTGVYFTDAQNGYVSSNEDVVLKTTDAGATWSEIIAKQDASFTDIIFTDANTGFMCGSAGFSSLILKTNDGGLSWGNSYFSAFGATLFTIGAFNNNDLGCGGLDVYLNTDNAGGIVASVSDELSNNAYKVYPSKPQSTINIDFQDKITSKVNVTIRDISGREVLSTNLNQSSSVNVSGLTNGVYILAIQNDTSTELFKIFKN